MTNETINPIDGSDAAQDAPNLQVAYPASAGTGLRPASSEYGANGGWTDEPPPAANGIADLASGSLPSNQTDDAGSGATNDNAELHAGDEGGELAVDIREPSADLAYRAVPGFEASASDCLNRALRVARSLNQTSLSSDHLMLALTMDPTARRHLERVGDVALLREAAMLRLGKANWKFARGANVDSHGDPSPTADFDEILKVARDAAAERDQKVAISDLINGFQTENEHLTYGGRDLAETVPAILDKIENGLVPRVADFMSRFESEVRDGAQRHLTAVLQDFGNSKIREMLEQPIAEIMENGRQLQERQLAEMADLSEQCERAIELRLNALLERFNERLQRAIDEAPSRPTPDRNGPGYQMIPPRTTTPTGGSEGTKGGFWQRYGLA